MATQELKDAFLAFRQQCIWTRICYNIYANLYEAGPETLDLLKRKAVAFFSDLNIILIEYCWIQISKHLDPKKTMGKENLTVKFIDSELSKQNLLTPEIEHLSSQLNSYCPLIKDARNKILSHSDLETALQNKILGAHTEKEVAMFFENLQQYCDAVGNAVGEGPLDFRSTPASGDVLDLLKRLKRA
jgi:hypothetical protein